MTHITSSIARHAIAPRNDEIHQAAKQAVQEEVQLIPVELLLRLKPEEKHDIYTKICQNSRGEKLNLL